MFVTTVVLAVALALVHLAAGIPEAVGQAKAVEQGEHVGVEPGPHEVVGAVVAHVRVKDTTPAIAVPALTTAYAVFRVRTA
ncbi:hypothetical protein ACRAKI_23835 [Saccharothrix isguenensis]